MKKYTLKDEQHAQTVTGVDYETTLNAQQRSVVEAPDGGLLVIAGAGSGKTHTLTYRVAKLIDRGVSPDQILLLTFTNKAARAMTDRVSGLVGLDLRQLWSGTFHSIGNRFLREFGSKLGFPDNYTILDAEDAGTLMSASLAETSFDTTETRFPRGRVLSRVFSYCINTQRTVQEVLAEHYAYFEPLHEPIRSVFQIYQARKLEMGLMDFDDLLLNWKRLLVEFDDVREKVTSRFRHILVDEYQDTNHLQGELVDLMASGHGNLMVVGDDCQSIYRFRGAEYRNILEFPKRFPGCNQYKLEVNYRSTPEILELANQSIRNNARQFQKKLKAARPSGFKPALVHLKDVYQQSSFVAQRILELGDEGVSLDEVAVLYRSHHHSMELQVELTKRGIPYVVRSGVRFFEQAHIKDVLSYLKFMFNPKDELSFLRLAQHYRGVGTKRAQQIFNTANRAGDPLAGIGSKEVMESLPSRVRETWSQGAGLLDELRRKRLSGSPAEMIDAIVGGPYGNYLKGSFDNAENRAGDLDQLSNYAAQYEDLDRFLGEITLLSSMSGQDIQVGGEQPDEYVTLSSIHQSKGLEWEAVFVLWVSDGAFPSNASLDSAEELEEERRLFYVATTRAKDELYLAHVLTQRGRDNRVTMLRESQFIDELRTGREDADPWEEWIIDAG